MVEVENLQDILPLDHHIENDDNSSDEEELFVKKKKKKVNSFIENDEEEVESKISESKFFDNGISKEDSGIVDESSNDSTGMNLNSSSNKKRFCFDDEDSENENEDANKNNDLGNIMSDNVVAHDVIKEEKVKKRVSLQKQEKNKILEELVAKKKYKTRGEKKIEEFKENSTEHLFSNKDLFSVDESSSSEDENKENSDEDVSTQIEKRIKKKKPEKFKKPTKNSIKERKSEQQRLCREQVVSIPYHQPDASSLKSLLQRIPNIEKKNTSKMKETKEELSTTPTLKTVYSQKPKLSVDVIEFEDDSSNEVQILNPNKEDKKLDSFLQRFAKHTKVKKEARERVDGVSIPEIITIGSQTPGTSHEILKTELKKRINEDRIRNVIESEKQMRIYDNEGFSDEDEVHSEEDDELNEEEEEGDNKNASGEECQDEDEELSKWNAEDERKQLEISMNEDEEKAEVKETGQLSSDLFIDHPSTAVAEEAHHTNSATIRCQDTQWSNSSSLIPAGQGNSNNSLSSVVGLTPFTKLLKSGLLDSASKRSMDREHSKESFGLELPCEDTQDLYKDDATAFKVSEDSQSMHPNFHFSLDEETQFEQILDSQGNFQDKKPKKVVAKTLFEGSKGTVDANEQSQVSMTQLLGFCSGSFSSNKPSNFHPTSQAKESTDLKDVLDERGNDLENVMEFCSGNMSDFKTQVGMTSGEVCSHDSDEGAVDFVKHFKDLSARTGTAALHNGNIETSTASVKIIESENNLPIFDGSVERKKSENDMKNENDLANESDVEEGDLNGERGLEENNINSVESELMDKSDVEENDINNKSDVENDDVNDDNLLNEDDETQQPIDSVSDDKTNGVSDDETNGVSDDETNDVSDDETNDVPDELKEWKESFIGDKKTKKLNKRAFYEDEAELSGSDNSDDEVLDSENDEYEVDSDVEDGLPRGEKLRRQVHKIHQRKMLDKEKQEVRILQELYIEDGELGVGEARRRNFRWRNIDRDNSFHNVSKGVSDGEGEDDDDEDQNEKNMKSRMERIEKEKFIQESQNEITEILDENSQCILNKIQNKGTVEPVNTIRPHTKIFNKRSGSFLSKAPSLASANSGAKQSTNQKSGKSFVFQTTDEKKTPISRDKKRALDKSKTCQPERKKLKLERKNSLPNSSSIFNLF